MSPSGSAAQFSLMNGRSRRSLWSWMARAKSSLPVPLSPWSSTVARVGAAIDTVCMSRRIDGLSPRICRSLRSSITSRRSAAFSRRRRTNSSAWSTASSSCCGRTGFVM